MDVGISDCRECRVHLVYAVHHYRRGGDVIQRVELGTAGHCHKHHQHCYAEDAPRGADAAVKTLMLILLQERCPRKLYSIEYKNYDGAEDYTLSSIIQGRGSFCEEKEKEWGGNLQGWRNCVIFAREMKGN